jgi:hypothetical protein
MIKPEGILTQERQTAVFNPLIKLRIDWNVEMEQSVSTIDKKDKQQSSILLLN